TRAKDAKVIKATKATKAASAAGRTTPGAARASGGKNTPSAGRDWPVLSSPARKVFADIGATKRDVWDYYAAVMDHLLPEIVGRPLSVIRCPSGTGKPCFFQKHHTAGLERVSSVRLQEEGGANAYYLVVEDAASVMELVQFNALE